jgi:methionyl-tRNA formyltransferase
MQKRAFILASEEAAERVIAIADGADGSWSFKCSDSRDALVDHFQTEKYDLLLSYATSVIVPGWILDKPNLIAVNIHAASPQYPGRDPHHFAVYDEATQYGATLHFMTESVDAGPIIDVELFDVPDGVRPIDLLDKANEAAYRLLEKYLPMLLSGNILPSNPDLAWTGKKRSRKDLLELCGIDAGISEEEFEKRQRACQMPGYDNLYTVIQGRRFKMETGLKE